MMKISLKMLLGISLLLLGGSFGFAQNDSQKGLASYWTHGMKNTVSSRTNYWIIGGMVAGTLAARPYDNSFQDYAQKHGLLPKDLSRFGDLYGGTWGHWVLFSFILMDGRHDSRAALYEKFEYTLLTLGTNGMLTALLKDAVGRERPNGRGNRSFPSGHTSHSFAIAAVSNELFGSKIGIPATTIAGIVALSRIHDNKHYLSDVIFGAGLGTLIGRGFAVPYREKMSSFSLNPNLRGGITLNYHFP